MDRITELAAELAILLECLDREVAAADRNDLMPPLAWLDEASQWLRYELARTSSGEPDPVPFTYIPLAYRR